MGLDISSAQFPESHSTNISFAVLNILESVPERFRATFDLVHIRLIFLGLKREDWAVAAQNLLQLLKPGGFVQWEEGDLDIAQVLQSQPSAPTSASKKLADLAISLNQPYGRFSDEPRRLVSILQSAGFSEVDEDIFSSDRVSGTREAFSQAILGACEGMLTMTLVRDREQAQESRKVHRKLREDADKECEGGKAYFRTDLHVVVGRRVT